MRRRSKSYCLSLCVALSALRAEPVAKLPDDKPELPKSGINLERPAGGWINVEVVGNRFVLSFFDAEKKPVPTDRPGGVVRYVYTARENKPPAPLARSEDGLKLVTPAKIRPPHTFHVHIVLRGERPEDADESYNFRYPG